MGYTYKNSASKNSIFTAAGVAKAATSDVVKNSTIAGVLDSSVAKASDVGLVPASDKKRTYTGYDRVSILDGVAGNLRGVASTTLLSPGSDKNTRKSILSLNALRVNKTATAVRDGKWNPVSGQFQATGGRVYPGTANDFATVGVDRETLSSKAVGGIHNYNYGATVATGIAYPARTQ